MVQEIPVSGIDQIIRFRRTVKPEQFNGKRIDDEEINTLIGLADCAPTHARTEPWRFIIFGPGKVKDFALGHAELYKQYASPETFTQQKFDNIKKQGDLTSHAMIVWMKRIPSHKIPEIEEIAAVSASIQNILLAAASRGIASFWSTGGMALHPSFHDHFKLGGEDRVIGILYLGYTDDAQRREPVRMIPLAEKMEWVR